MYFRLSNTAQKETIEKWTGALFKYPSLYRPQELINGLNEVSIPIISMEERQTLSWAIWGMLPENFKEDWAIFQNLSNTLNFHEKAMSSNLWYAEAFKSRRCLIPVTGFFTSYIKNGQSFPHFISRKNGDPFYLAGIYTILEDGFNTSSILLGKANSFIRTSQNVVNTTPLIIDRADKNSWLDSKTSLNLGKRLLQPPEDNEFQFHPIAKELFNHDITYDSMLEPYDYEGPWFYIEVFLPDLNCFLYSVGRSPYASKNIFEK